MVKKNVMQIGTKMCTQTKDKEGEKKYLMTFENWVQNLQFRPFHQWLNFCHSAQGESSKKLDRFYTFYKPFIYYKTTQLFEAHALRPVGEIEPVSICFNLQKVIKISNIGTQCYKQF